MIRKVVRKKPAKKMAKRKNVLVAAIEAPNNFDARTENNMKAMRSTNDACVDLFFKIGAMRGQNVIPAFTKALTENPEYALRIALWARDVRGGAGERKIFRDILQHLQNDSTHVEPLIHKAPLVGRWDDLLVFDNDNAKSLAFAMIARGLNDKSTSGLVAKWLPRKGPLAVELRNFFDLTPKGYRKLLVSLTNVVEQKMCARDWESIEFGKLPSLASARYKKAFTKRAGDAYKAYLEGLKKGTEKVNAGAVYPYDVIKTAFDGDRSAPELIEAQWNALPNYVGNASIMPMVDVSGSMSSPVGGSNPNLSAMAVAVSLGLYLADKNKGPFKDCFLTFSGNPKLQKLKGSILKKMDQLHHAEWGMNTNLHAAFQLILDTATDNDVPAEDMPETVLILSDMQFDSCVTHDDSALEMIKRKYTKAGYKMPKVVFWNLRDAGNVPANFRQDGTALVSGFSPAIMKAILAGKDFTPEGIMLQAIMNEKYAL